MRRLCLILVLSAVLAPAALAAPRALGDGTVATRNAAGTVTIAGHGAFWGTVGAGTITVTDLDPTDDPTVKVSNWDKESTPAPGTTVYRGDTGLRFQIVSSGRVVVALKGTGISFSGVGAGRLKLAGSDTASSTGSFQLGDGPWQPVPYVLTTFAFPDPS